MSPREQEISKLSWAARPGYDLDVSSDLPAVIEPQPAEVVSPEPEAVLTPPPGAREAWEPRWMTVAAPLVPGAAQGVSRALLELLEGMGVQVPTVQDLARATVEAACELAGDTSVPPAVRGGAVADARRVVEVVAQVERERPGSKSGWASRLLQAIVLATVFGTVLSGFKRPA